MAEQHLKPPPEPVIVDFPIVHLNDIPAQLRDVADRIEAGEYGLVERAICFIDADTRELFSWGKLNCYDVLALCELAKQTALLPLIEK